MKLLNCVSRFKFLYFPPFPAIVSVSCAGNQRVSSEISKCHWYAVLPVFFSKLKNLLFNGSPFFFPEFIWAQEEHRNQGAWSFVAPRFKNLLGMEVMKPQIFKFILRIYFIEYFIFSCRISDAKYRRRQRLESVKSIWKNASLS